MYNTLRPYVQVGLLALCVFFFAQSRCAGERSGVLKERVSQEVQKRQASENLAASHKKRADSLAAVVKKSQESLQVAEKRKEKTRIVYTTLRDSVRLVDTTSVRLLIQAADSALAASDSSHRIKDRIIEAQSHQIVTLQWVIDEKDQQIISLNRQLRLTVKQSKPPLLQRALSTTKTVAVGAVIGAVAWESIR